MIMSRGSSLSFLLLISILLMQPETATATRRTTPAGLAKACAANMRVLLGAVEMYNMDKPVKLDMVDEKVIARLVRESYLKMPLSRPDPGCSYSGRDLVRSTNPDECIRCVVHGTVADVQKFASEYYQSEKMKTIIVIGTIAAVILFGLIMVFTGRKQAVEKP